MPKHIYPQSIRAKIRIQIRKILNHIEIYYLFHGASTFLETYLFQTDMYWIRLRQKSHMDYMNVYFRNRILVFKHCKYKIYGIEYQNILQKLIPSKLLLDYYTFVNFVTQYLHEMKYFVLFPEVGIYYPNLYSIVQTLRLRKANEFYIVMLGFSFTIFYWDEFTQQEENICYLLVSQ